MGIKNSLAVVAITLYAFLNTTWLFAMDKNEKYEENLVKFLSEDSKENLRKKLVSSEIVLKEFILDFYSDLKMADLAASKGLDGNENYKNKLLMLQKKLLIQELVDDTIKNVKYPDFEEYAKEKYDANKKNYVISEKRKVAHILIAPEENQSCSCENKVEITASDVLAKIKNGKSFEELAEEYSVDKSNATNGGVIPDYVDDSGKFVKKFVVASFKLQQVGQISGIVKTRFGDHIIKLLEIVPSQYIEYDKVKEKIIADLKEEYLSSKVNNLRSTSYPDLDQLDLKKITDLINSIDKTEELIK